MIKRLDDIHDFLKELRNTAPDFHDSMVKEFLQDKLMFTTFEKDLAEALHKIVGITISRNPLTHQLFVNDEEVQCYEDVFKRVVELLKMPQWSSL